MMLPTDMNPLKPPEADAWAVPGNQRDIAEIPTGTIPAWATPMKARAPVMSATLPRASPAVASDQSAAKSESAQRDPSL